MPSLLQPLYPLLRQPPRLPDKKLEDCEILHVIHRPPFPTCDGFAVVGLAEPGPDVAVPGTPTHQMLCARAEGLFMAHSGALLQHATAYAFDQVCIGSTWIRVYVACLAIEPVDGAWQ